MKWGWSSRLPVKAFGSNNGVFCQLLCFFGFSPLAGQGVFLSNLVFWCNSRLSLDETLISQTRARTFVKWAGFLSKFVFSENLRFSRVFL